MVGALLRQHRHRANFYAEKQRKACYESAGGLSAATLFPSLPKYYVEVQVSAFPISSVTTGARCACRYWRLTSAMRLRLS
jgi:hypothetical protein